MYVNVVIALKDSTVYEYDEVKTIGMNALGFLTVQTEDGWSNFNLTEVSEYHFQYQDEVVEDTPKEPVGDNDNVVKFTK